LRERVNFRRSVTTRALSSDTRERNYDNEGFRSTLHDPAPSAPLLFLSIPIPFSLTPLSLASSLRLSRALHSSLESEILKFPKVRQLPQVFGKSGKEIKTRTNEWRERERKKRCRTRENGDAGMKRRYCNYRPRNGDSNCRDLTDVPPFREASLLMKLEKYTATATTSAAIRVRGRECTNH